MEFIDWLLGGVFAWLAGCFILICLKFLNSKSPLDVNDPDDCAAWTNSDETRV